MDRREFLTTGLAGSAAMTAGMLTPAAVADVPDQSTRRFRLNYAPHVGMFRHLAGDDPADQIRFMADQGFRTLEDVGLKNRSTAWQRRMRSVMDRCGISMGQFTATADYAYPTFALGRSEWRQHVVAEMQESLIVAERMQAGWLTVVPGKAATRLPRQIQFNNAVDLLRRCADLCERQGRALVIEPIDQSGMLVQTVAQARELCRAVDSPACRLLFDIGGQPASSARLLAEIDASWNEIGYFQLGDNPGRKEPGTGTIDFRTVLQHLANRGFAGVLGMDHGNSLPGEEGELRVIAAYDQLDAVWNLGR
jgi:hydroxypyruvate isomerase